MLNPIRDAELLNLGLDCEGIIDLATCHEAGITEDKTRWLIDSGRWQCVYPRTLATFSGPVPYRSRLRAAVLYAGAGAALSHETAGARLGLCTPSATIHVTVPYEREVDRQPNLAIHRSRKFGAHHIAAGEPRCTTIERTVLDLLARRTNADGALGLVGDALRTRRTTAHRLRSALVDAPRTRWRRVVLEAMPDLSAGAQSPLELREAALRRRHGLPMGVRQAGRTAEGAEYLDVLVEPWRIHVELDGRLGHDRTRERWRDMRRDNRSEVAGLRHLRYGWADIVDRPCEVAIEQALILRQQGWPGTFKRCPACPRILPAGL